MAKSLHLAKIIITNNGDPIINGGLLIEDSKIIAVSHKDDFGYVKDTIDHGEAIICPGFINLHTHLLYSNTFKINGSNGLFPWLESLVDKNINLTDDDYIKSINYGIKESLSSGTTFIVENTPNLLSAKELAKSPLKALIGLEAFGSDEEKADETFSSLISVLSPQSSVLTFSPHAPYDVSAPLWKKLIDWSEKNNKPLLTHLEESPSEKLWWQKKEGPGVNFWRKINKLDSKLKYWKKYNSGIDFLNKNNLLSKNMIATHLTQASKEELKILKSKNIKAVHCPRSNFYLNNGTTNLKLWDEIGLSWGLGTDSIASNENLNLLEELRFTLNNQKLVYDYKILNKEAFLSITHNCAKILSKENELGCLKNRFFADFLVFNINNQSALTYKDPYYSLIWEVNSKKDLREVWINGKKVWLARATLTKI